MSSDPQRVKPRARIKENAHSKARPNLEEEEVLPNMRGTVAAMVISRQMGPIRAHRHAAIQPADPEDRRKAVDPHSPLELFSKAGPTGKIGPRIREKEKENEDDGQITLQTRVRDQDLHR